MHSLWSDLVRQSLAPAMPFIALQEMALETAAPMTPERAMLAGLRIGSRMLAPLHDPGFRIRWTHDAADPHEKLDVAEEIAAETPFCRLRHFVRDGASLRPRLLLLAPYSGHYASLLRETVRELLPAHDVFVTEWRNAREIPAAAGRFGLDAYIDHVIRFAVELGGPVHMMAVCQPAPLALVASVRLAELGRMPASLVLMGGPVDARRSPTDVNRLATRRDTAWFERLVSVVGRGPGAGRAVYPGTTQLMSFVAMNLDRHARSQLDYAMAEIAGDRRTAKRIDTFYRDYLAVLDLPAEFYLETVERIFRRHELATGAFRHAGRSVDFSRLRDLPLITIEGGRDDICGRGQTEAAHDLVPAAAGTLRRRHFEEKAGHYGLFSGSAWRQRIAPAITSFIEASATS